MHQQVRIVFVVSSLQAGGAERVASILLNNWAGVGYDVTLLTFDDPETDHFGLSPAINRRTANLTWNSPNALYGIWSYLQRTRIIRNAIDSEKPDIVISFIDRTNILVLGSLLGSQVPVIVSERVDPTMHDIGGLWSALRRLMYRFAARVVVQTPAVAEWAHKVVRTDRVTVIPNPLANLPSPQSWSSRPKQLTAMGRLVPQKGFDLLLRAFAMSDGHKDNWHLTIIGEGPQRGELESLIRDLDLQTSVDLCGVVRDPSTHLDETKIFILPSRFEGFPNALLEAMAMGCACIAADCPSGPGELIEHGKNGLLVDVEDIDGLTDAINRLTSDPVEADKLSLTGTQVRSSYAIESIMKHWDELITQTIRIGNRAA